MKLNCVAENSSGEGLDPTSTEGCEHMFQALL